MPSPDLAPNRQLYRLERQLTRAQVVDELASMPARLGAIVRGVPEGALTHAGDGEWSALQTLCHVRDATLVYAARFRWMVLNDDPLLPNFDEDRWVAEATETPSDVPGLLDMIAGSRADLVRLLSRMPEQAWARTGRHEVMGTVVLEHYVRHQVAHEDAHLAQLRVALGGR